MHGGAIRGVKGESWLHHAPEPEGNKHDISSDPVGLCHIFKNIGNHVVAIRKGKVPKTRAKPKLRAPVSKLPRNSQVRLEAERMHAAALEARQFTETNRASFVEAFRGLYTSPEMQTLLDRRFAAVIGPSARVGALWENWHANDCGLAQDLDYRFDKGLA